MKKVWLGIFAVAVLVCIPLVQGSIIQSNTTYADGTIATLPVSNSDLINFGASTLDSFTVSANSNPDETPDRGAIDGAADNLSPSYTWFSNHTGDTGLDKNPGVFTFNLDVSENTFGYDIARIDSFAGFRLRQLADQVMTVEYSLVGDAAFVILDTYSYLDPAGKEYSRISLADDTADYMLTGVDALRFSYADPLSNTYNEIMIQEIDVIGVAAVPEPATIGMLGASAALILFVRRRLAI
jgi:hypothetical protein